MFVPYTAKCALPSVPKQAQPAHVRVLPRQEELRQAACDADVFLLWGHSIVVLQRFGDEEEEVGGGAGDVALPEVEQIHVVGGGFAAFDFEQDADAVQVHEVVGAEASDGVGEEAFALAVEAEGFGGAAEGGLDFGAGGAGSVRGHDLGQRCGFVQDEQQALGEAANVRPFLGRAQRLLHECRQFNQTDLRTFHGNGRRR
jgi:hypothetical protein